MSNNIAYVRTVYSCSVCGFSAVAPTPAQNRHAAEDMIAHLMGHIRDGQEVESSSLTFLFNELPFM